MKVECFYPGAAHSPDNIIAWVPSEKILFGGCMVKSNQSTGLGNIADADLKLWPQTIKKIISSYPDAEIVIPGHGNFGDKSLLLHSLKLLK
jgi:glyoxylase-like metal-dependent hydrolase (beta-lactamase superfamily II)